MPTLYRKCIDFLKTFPPYFRHFYGFFNRVNRFVFLFPFAFFFLFAWRHLLLESLVFSMFTFFYSLAPLSSIFYAFCPYSLSSLFRQIVLSFHFVAIKSDARKKSGTQMSKLSKIDPLHFENCAKQKHWKLFFIISWQRQISHASLHVCKL